MRNMLLVCAVIALAPLMTVAQQAQMPITTTSPEARALYEKALDYAENVEFEPARGLLDQAIQKDPGFAMAYALRARTGGGFNVAQQNRAKAASLAGTVSAAERLWILAAQAQADADMPKMKQHVAELVKLYPNDKHVAYFAGIAMLATSEDEALQHLKRAVTIDPKFAAAYNQMGYIYIGKSDFAGAEAALKQYVATRPDSANPYDSYGELLLTLGRYDESIAQYEKANAKSPGFPMSWAGIGHNQVFKRDYARARESYKRLYDSPDVSDRAGSLYWVAVSYVHEGKLIEAIQELQRLLEFATKQKLLPTAISTHLGQAVLLSESGKAGEAVGHIDEAEKLIEGLPIAELPKANWRRQALLTRAMTAARAKDFATARTAMQRAKNTIAPEFPLSVTQYYEGVMGLIEVLAGNYDAALVHFKDASPDDPYLMFYKAEAMRLKGDVTGAVPVYKKVAAANVNSLWYALVRSRAIKASGT